MILTNEEITERRGYDQPDAHMVPILRNYAEGKQPDTLSAQQRALLKQRQQHRMVDNIIRLVLNTAVSALRLERWDVAGESPLSMITGDPVSDDDAAKVQNFLASTWLTNNMQRVQAEVNYASMRDSNSAVSLAWRNGRPRIAREPWWDGDTGMYVAYDDDDEYLFAVKEWMQRENSGTTHRRRTVYETGRIYRWIQKGEGWQPYEADGISPELAWTRVDGTPLKIPVIHFPNGTMPTETSYGASDISDLLGLQDDINSAQRDIAAAAMQAAFQRLFVSGVANPGALKFEPGSAAGDDSPDAKVTVIPPGETGALIGVHAQKRESIAIGSRTPMHNITGQWPSGSAILQADMARRDKAEQQADVHGPRWTTVAHRLTEIANAYGALDLREDVPITSVYAPTERIDDLTKLQVDQARATYWETISRLPEESMIQAGVDPETANKIVNQRGSMFSLVADAGLEM